MHTRGKDMRDLRAGLIREKIRDKNRIIDPETLLGDITIIAE
jgi:hypothetical protein